MEAIDFFAEQKTWFVVGHIISVVIGMGSALLSDVLFNFYSKDKVLNTTEQESLSILSRTVWIALTVIIISGLALFFSDPARYVVSTKFITKMLIMGVLLLNGLFLSYVVSPHLQDKGLLKFKNKQTIRRMAFAGGAVSVSSWVIVCVLGVLPVIPFSISTAMMLYGGVIIAAILIAMFVERVVFTKR